MNYPIYYNGKLLATVNTPSCFISKAGTSILYGFIDSDGNCHYIQTCEVDESSMSMHTRSIVNSKLSIVPPQFNKPLFIKPEAFIKHCQKNALRLLKGLVKLVSTKNNSQQNAA